jgi:hypothetical protein
VGDGTTSVVIIAAELLKRANELVKNNIHPTIVMAGYRLALKEAVKYIKSHLVVSTDAITRQNLINAGKTYDFYSPLSSSYFLFVLSAFVLCLRLIYFLPMFLSYPSLFSRVFSLTISHLFSPFLVLLRHIQS